MITWHDFYTVMAAMIPLYVAMMLAYSSVRWWKIFNPNQCSGINRFVAVFAVPLLSFHFISTNNPYQMNLRFIAADTLHKALTLGGLTAWAALAPNGSPEWMITLFSLCTLPNTLVMGIPLLIAMYGEYSGSLMVQVVVLQCIIWYTLLLFLFEYRAARILILEQFPKTAASIISFKVGSDVVSLDGRDLLETDAQMSSDGKLHVTVRRSNASRRSLAGGLFTPRPSNLSGAEIYSLSSSQNPNARDSNFNNVDDFYSMMRPSNFGSVDLYSVPSSQGPTPRTSNYEENGVNSLGFGFYPTQSGSGVVDTYPTPNLDLIGETDGRSGRKNVAYTSNEVGHEAKELHKFLWSSTTLPASEVRGLHVCDGVESTMPDQSKQMLVVDQVSQNDGNKESEVYGGAGAYAQEDHKEKPEIATGLSKLEASPTGHGGGGHSDIAARKKMPPASVMIRLILIMVWRKLVRNPNTYSSLIGLSWSLIAFRWNVRMPKIVEKSISILSDAGLGMAMFSLGLFMALQPKIIACGNSVAVFSMAVRFIAGPVVMAVASLIIGLRGNLLRVAIVQAALPQGIVPFVFAKEYDNHPAILSTAVIFGMLIALPIDLIYYILLGL
ncbi:hypothetical protein V2J09_020589 [Rumex salicifolius]